MWNDAIDKSELVTLKVKTKKNSKVNRFYLNLIPAQW